MIDDKNSLDPQLSRHTRNALLSAGLRNHEQVVDVIKSGGIFNVPRLGLVGIKEAVTWALNDKPKPNQHGQK